MKNEYKIIIGAIVVILLLLVGAYALNGSSPQPSATPTVLPVTATPTPVPAGGGNVTPSVTPSVAPSVTPSVTPEPTITPTPATGSGVKLTEFGYWITYPPLGPQNWSSPKPAPEPKNVVYFNPASENLNLMIDNLAIGPAVNIGPHGTATVHRYGDLNGTVYVTIVASNSSNTWLQPANIPYRFEYYVWGSNLTQVGDNTYELRFDPGVSEQGLIIPVRDAFAKSVDALSPVMTEGFVKLTITDVDGGYGIGSQDEYMLNINRVSLPVVQFATDAGYLNTGEGCVVEDYADQLYNISFVITRTGDLSGTFAPSVYIDESYPSSDSCIGLIKVDPFVAGAPTTKAYMYYDLSYYSSGYADALGQAPYAQFGLIPSPHYNVGSPQMYTIYLSIAE